MDTAVEAARAGGRILLRYFAKELRVDYKGEINLVTEADRQAEAGILRVLQNAFPHHAILAEESGEQFVKPAGNAGYKWIVDPLDGTTNFAHTYPVFCVSIALEVQGEIILGVIYDPIRKEIFTAEKNKGATINGHPIRVSGTKNVNKSLLVTGFAYNIRRAKQNNLDHFAAFALRAQGIRRSGSAALDLSYVACGRFDGFWEMNLEPWDSAAGLLLVVEAGGHVSDFSNQPYHIYKKEIIASNGLIHPEMISVLNKKVSGE